MKTRTALTIALAAAALAAAAAEPIERLELNDGSVLEQARIKRAGGEGVTVFHSGGVATVAWTNIPHFVIESNEVARTYIYKEKEKGKAVASPRARTPRASIDIVSRGNPPEYADKLKTRLGYLSDITETQWVQIEHNTVYVGMSHLPPDAELVAKFAALHGNEAIGFGCHVWVTDGPRGWRPGSRASFRRASARHGKVER